MVVKAWEISLQGRLVGQRPKEEFQFKSKGSLLEKFSFAQASLCSIKIFNCSYKVFPPTKTL